jgi:hypothetical protein
MSDEQSTIGVVVPCVASVITKINACERGGIGSFVQTLLDSINLRFNNIETQMFVL